MKKFKHPKLLCNSMKVIMKVWINKANGQLLITVPKDSDIHKGDYVELIKVK